MPRIRGGTKIATVWRALLALGLGLMLALGVDQTVPLLLPHTTENRHWYLNPVQYHPILGWSGYPHFAGTKDGIPVRTNSLGYRDLEPDEAEDDRKTAVLFLGDSFTWGDEVHVEERFTSLLEGPSIRAINKAIIGYGTGQSLLDHLLTREKRRYAAVVLALYTGNDLNDNANVESPSGPRPRLIRCDRQDAGEGLCLEGVPVPPVVDWPEHRLIDPRGGVFRSLGWSGMVTVASERRAPGFLIERRIADQMGDQLQALPFPLVTRTSDAPIDDRIGQLEAILRAMNRTIRADGRAFGVLLFPSARVYAGTGRDELHEYGEIVGVLRRLDIPFADYYGHTRGVRMEDLYSGSDGHWRATGHQEAAAQLRPLLVALTGELTVSSASR